MKYLQINPRLASMFPHFQTVYLHNGCITFITSCYVIGMLYKQRTVMLMETHVYNQFLASFCLWKIMYPNM